MSWRNHVWRVHRIAAHLWLGLDLDDTETKVCHHCDVPACFNPEHLYLGTQKTNVQDMVDRGRNYAGPKPFDRCLKGHPLEGDNVRATFRGACEVLGLTRSPKCSMWALWVSARVALKVIGVCRAVWMVEIGCRPRHHRSPGRHPMTTPEPNAAQLADLNRWLHDPTDTRTRDELRADLRALGDGIHPVGAR